MMLAKYTCLGRGAGEGDALDVSGDQVDVRGRHSDGAGVGVHKPLVVKLRTVQGITQG